jgi:hypothetical protein
LGADETDPTTLTRSPKRYPDGGWYDGPWLAYRLETRGARAEAVGRMRDVARENIASGRRGASGREGKEKEKGR